MCATDDDYLRSPRFPPGSGIMLAIPLSLILWALIFFGVTAARGEDFDEMFSKGTASTANIAMLGSLRPTSFTLTCGTGSVSINVDTGAVTYAGDCAPPDAARAFWAFVERYGAARCEAKPQ